MFIDRAVGFMTIGTGTDRYGAMDITGQIPEFFVALIAQIRNGGHQVDLARETTFFPIPMACFAAQTRFVLVPDDLGRSVRIRRRIGVDCACMSSAFKFTAKGGHPVKEEDQRLMPFGLTAAEHKEQGNHQHPQQKLDCCWL